MKDNAHNITAKSYNYQQLQVQVTKAEALITVKEK